MLRTFERRETIQRSHHISAEIFSFVCFKSFVTTGAQTGSSHAVAFKAPWVAKKTPLLNIL
jgi:hypothetical protein